jgi:hypothetical protein
MSRARSPIDGSGSFEELIRGAPVDTCARIVSSVAAGLVAAVSAPTGAAVFTVNTPYPVSPSDCAQVNPDVDECWFGDALAQANLTPDFDHIEFQLEPQEMGKPVPCSIGTIQAGIYQPIEIDGFTQSVVGLPANTPPVALDGALLLGPNADGSILRGLVIPGSSQYAAINVGSATDVTIEGNWIGFTSLGYASGGAVQGISCYACTDLTIGNTTASSMGLNVIGGIEGPAIDLTNASAVTIQNTWFGLEPDGSTPLPNEDGVVLEGGVNVRIGGRFAGEGNVIAESGHYGVNELAGHDGLGIYLNNTSGVEIVGNFIGTNTAGTEARINRGGGIRVEGASSRGVVIGGGLPGEGNVISGSGDPAFPRSEIEVGVGIWLGPFSGGEWRIQGNKIGTNAAGDAPIPNLRDNVVIVSDGTQTLIGGTGPSEGNRIAYSLLGSGVVYPGGVSGDHTAILGNQIYGNEGGDLPSFQTWKNPGLGISRFRGSGPIANDEAMPPYDTQPPPNHPVLEAASSDGARTRVQGELRTRAASEIRVEFFSSALCDPSGFGEGENFLGAFEGDSGPLGELVFDAMLPVGIPESHTVVTATATQIAGAPITSEFSACVAVPEPDGAPLIASAVAALVCLCTSTRPRR